MTASPVPKCPQPADTAKSSSAMLPPSVGHGHGDGGELGTQRASGHTSDGGIGVQQGSQFPAALRRRGQSFRSTVDVAVRPSQQRNARPFHAEGTGVGGSVTGIVQCGDDVVEQVLDTQAQTVQITLR